MHLGVKNEGGKVVFTFDRDIAYLEMDPDNAVKIAEAMTSAAFEADTKLKPVGETLKASLVEKHRDKLVPRVTLMLGSMRQDKLKSDGQLAMSIIDTVFAEVFT